MAANRKPDLRFDGLIVKIIVTDVEPLPPRSFAGWVPTIMGHLSFSLVGVRGDGWHYANAEGDENGDLKTHRLVVVDTRRTARDLPYTGWPIPLFVPQIQAEYILIATTKPSRLPIFDAKDGVIGEILDDQDMLHGEVFMIPYLETPRLELARKLFIRNLRASLLSFTEETPLDVRGNTRKLAEEIRDLLLHARAAGVQFLGGPMTLYRTGEFRLSLEAPDLTMAQTSGWSDRKDQALARQLFYFVKEAAHRHYHHDPRADALLPLIHATSEDDRTWRRETLWSLTRSIVEVRRRDRLPGYRSALGLLAYADAFQATLARVERAQSGGYQPAEIARYDLAHTRLSIEAKIDELSGRNSGSNDVVAFMATIVVAATALWFAAVQIRHEVCGTAAHAPDCPLNPVGGQLARWVIAAPGGLVAILTLLALIYLDATGRVLRLTNTTRGVRSFAVGLTLALGGTLARMLRRRAQGLPSDAIARWIMIGLTLVATLVLTATFLLLLHAKNFSGLSAPLDWIRAPSLSFHK